MPTRLRERACRLVDDMDVAVGVLRAGGVVAAATESFFGLLADATRSDAIDQLGRLKFRSAEKGFPLILPDERAWSTVVADISEQAWCLARAFWPGPLSIALPAAPSLDPRVPLAGSVAVRIPPTCPALELARRLGRPVTATSANPPGEPPGTAAADVVGAFAGVDLELLVLDGKSPGGKPSTVVVFEHGSWSFARIGALSEADVRVALRELPPIAP